MLKDELMFQILAFILASSFAHAIPGAPTLGPTRVHGANCPILKAHAVYDKNLNEIHIALDGFSLQAGGSSKLTPTLMERECGIRVAVELPANTQLKIWQGEFRERVVLPQGADSRYGLAISRVGSGAEKSFVKEHHALGATEDTMVKKTVSDITTSGCGESFDLEIKTSARLANQNVTDTAKLGLSKKDLLEAASPGMTTDGPMAILRTELVECQEGGLLAPANLDPPSAHEPPPVAPLVN